MLTEEQRAELRRRLKPLRDNVVWIRDEAKSAAGLFLPTVKLHRGEVLAVGPGRRVKRARRHDNPDPMAAPGDAYFYMESGPETGKIRPTGIKVGDRIEFSQYGQTEFEIDGFAGIKLVLSGAKSVLGYADGDATHAFMFPSPAGFDDSRRKVVGKF